MSRPALFVFAWAAWLTVLAAVLFVWTPGDWVQWASFAAAAALAWTVGLAVLLRPRVRSAIQLIPEFSPGAVLLALGIAGLVQGASLGLWLVYIGAGIVAIGLGVAIHETLAARRGQR